ncbi:MAG: hypothetical protein KAR21_02400, partial [Spirochaetales bacterium]|nr:hypothetical protein [Spirochaetales bacterium]
MTGKIVSKISVFFYTLLILIFTWLIVSSIEIVPPGRVHIVRVLGLHGNNVALKAIPLVNENDRRKIFFKQPKIPFLKIGFIEASLSIEEVREIAASFAFYTTDKVTGVSDDREWVQAFTLEGRIEEITDWNKFVSNIDIQQINFETGESPYTRKYNNRIDIIAEELKILASSGSTK